MIPPDLPASAALAPAPSRSAAAVAAERPPGEVFAALLGQGEEETAEDAAEAQPAPGTAPLPALALGLSQAAAEAPSEGGEPGPEIAAPEGSGPGRRAAKAPPAQAVTLAAAPVPEAAAGEEPPVALPPAERPSAVTGEAPAVRPSAPAPEPLAAVASAEPSLAAAGSGAAWRLAAAAEAVHPARTAVLRAEPKAVAEQITLAVVQAAEPEVELRLDPPELGRVQIRLTHGEAGLQAVVLADRPETQDFLRRHAETLARELTEAGYAQVSLDFAGGREAPPRDPGGEARQGLAEAAAAPAAAAPAPVGRAAGLDIRL